MNYGTIYRRVVSEGGFDVSAGNVPLSQVQQWIAERYSELVLEAEWLQETQTLATLTAGTSIYSFDNVNFDRLRSLFVGGAEYPRVSAEQMVKLKNATLGLGRDTVGAYSPSYGADGTISVELFPGPTVAGATLTAILNAEPPPLVGDADVPIIPAPYHVAIVKGAIATGLMFVDEDQQSAQGFEAQFEAAKQKLQRLKNKRVGSGVVQVQLAGVHF